MSRSARLLALMQSLRRRRRPVAAADLAGELCVSLRTVYRDVATLVAEGAPIEGEAGLGYVLKPGFFLPPLMFDEDEIDAVILGLGFVRQRGDADLRAAADDALAKIEAVLPARLADAAATSGLRVPQGGTGAAQVLGPIRQAIHAERKLALHYTDRKGRATTRIVWPIAVGFFDAGEMLAAWCELRADFRHFRLDRIASAEIEAERMPRRHRLLLAEWRLAEELDSLS